MFDFFKRGRLVRRGLASRKMRRRRARSELQRNLEYSPYTKVVIFAVFVGGLAFLVFSGQQPEPTKNFVIALLVLATAITQLWINQPKSFSRSSRILLIFSLILVQLSVTKLLLVLCNSGSYRFLKPEMAGLIMPYAFAPLVLSVLLGRHHGLYVAFFVSLWSSVLFGPIDAPVAGNESDQRLYGSFPHIAGATAWPTGPCWLLRGARHLVTVADIWFDWTDQLVLSDGQ